MSRRYLESTEHSFYSFITDMVSHQHFLFTIIQGLVRYLPFLIIVNGHRPDFYDRRITYFLVDVWINSGNTTLCGVDRDRQREILYSFSNFGVRKSEEYPLHFPLRFPPSDIGTFFETPLVRVQKCSFVPWGMSVTKRSRESYDHKYFQSFQELGSQCFSIHHGHPGDHPDSMSG